jgi:DNA-binding response OmpR family regulator
MAVPTILILDDDDDLRLSVAGIFGLLGRVCVVLPSVAAMIDASQAVLRCELAILDVNLGQGVPSGIDAHSWLRGQAFGGRIVFLTGHAQSHPLVERASALGERVLRKPISTVELRALVDAPGAP